MHHNYIPVMYMENQNLYVQNGTQSEIKNYNVPFEQNKYPMYRTYPPNELQEFQETHNDQYQFIDQNIEYNQYTHNSNSNTMSVSTKPEVSDKQDEISQMYNIQRDSSLNCNMEKNAPNDKIIDENTIDDSENKIILEIGPGSHQIKEYNIRPVNVIKVNYTPSNSDILVVKLMCDPAMKLKDCEFFLTALSPKYQTDDSDRLYLSNLKISKDMLKGRTKGYKFNLVYSLFIKGEESYRVISEPFYLWSNVNQAGFPREERDSYVNTEKKRKRQSSK